ADLEFEVALWIVGARREEDLDRLLLPERVVALRERAPGREVRAVEPHREAVVVAADADRRLHAGRSAAVREHEGGQARHLAPDPIAEDRVLFDRPGRPGHAPAGEGNEAGGHRRFLTRSSGGLGSAPCPKPHPPPPAVTSSATSSRATARPASTAAGWSP